MSAFQAYWLFGVVLMLWLSRRWNKGLTVLDILLFAVAGWAWPVVALFAAMFWAVEHWKWLTARHFIPDVAQRTETGAASTEVLPATPERDDKTAPSPARNVEPNEQGDPA